MRNLMHTYRVYVNALNVQDSFLKVSVKKDSSTCKTNGGRVSRIGNLEDTRHFFVEVCGVVLLGGTNT